jgi:hypothetical protein
MHLKFVYWRRVAGVPAIEGLMHHPCRVSVRFFQSSQFPITFEWPFNNIKKPSTPSSLEGLEVIHSFVSAVSRTRGIPMVHRCVAHHKLHTFGRNADFHFQFFHPTRLAGTPRTPVCSSSSVNFSVNVLNFAIWTRALGCEDVRVSQASRAAALQVKVLALDIRHDQGNGQIAEQTLSSPTLRPPGAHPL